MDMNLYALEKQVESKLSDARVAGVRAALLSSLQAEHRTWVAVVATVVTRWTGRDRSLRGASARVSGA